MPIFDNFTFGKDQKNKQQAATAPADNTYATDDLFPTDFKAEPEFSTEDTYGTSYDTQPVAQAPVRKKPQQTAAGSAVTKVRIMKPKTYADARNIASKLIEGYIVSMNLENVENDEEVKNIMTFLAGVVFAIHAETVSVSDQVWLLYPKNLVQLSEETSSEDAE